MWGWMFTPVRWWRARSMTRRGRCRTLRVSPKTEAVVDWVRALPGPVAVAYEAGPTGFALARALTAAGVRCEVVAPSKLERPPGDRVKTDRRDAERLARLLRIGELPGVRVPSQAEEAARELVRAREDTRGDLMRARHRLSKLLLRHGFVYGTTAPGPRRTGPGCAPAVRPAWRAAGLRRGFRHGADGARPPGPARCGDHRDGHQQRVRPGGGPVVLSARGRHPDRVRAGRRGRRLAAVHRRRRSAPTWGWYPPSPPAARPLAKARSPRPATAMPGDCWSRPPGTTASRIGPAAS